MHQYTIEGANAGIRQKVTVIQIVISIIICTLINLAIDNFGILDIGYISAVNGFFKQWPFFGFSFGYISMFLVFKIIDWLFDKYIWKMKPFNRLLRIPDFSGIWKGILMSSYDNGTKIHMEADITQTWKNISIICKFSKSMSGSNSAIINCNSSKGKKLQFTYNNESQDPAADQSMHIGVCELYLSATPGDQSQELIGTYYNNRGGGNKGSIKLKKE